MQYSLKSLLAITVAAAVATWVLFVLPDGIGVVLLSAILAIFPGMIVAGIVYFREYRRAFCIGAAPSQLLLMVFVWMLMMRLPYTNPGSFRYAGNQDALWAFKLYIAGSLFVSILAGLAGVLVRYLALRAESPQSKPHVSASRAAAPPEEPVSVAD